MIQVAGVDGTSAIRNGALWPRGRGALDLPGGDDVGRGMGEDGQANNQCPFGPNHKAESCSLTVSRVPRKETRIANGRARTAKIHRVHAISPNRTVGVINAPKTRMAASFRSSATRSPDCSNSSRRNKDAKQARCEFFGEHYDPDVHAAAKGRQHENNRGRQPVIEA